jgi:hypothetical protein
MEIALHAGADDMEAAGEVFEITCDPGAYEQLKQTLQEKEIATEVAEISMVPQNTIDIGDEQIAKRIISLMEAFEDHDDVQNAYANFDISEEIFHSLLGVLVSFFAESADYLLPLRIHAAELVAVCILDLDCLAVVLDRGIGSTCLLGDPRQLEMQATAAGI